MRIFAVILNFICLVYVGASLVSDIGDYYFDTTGFYLLLCFCFIINLVALRRPKMPRALEKNKEPDEKQGR